MKWAARGGDATAHGGSITPTQMNVFICGQPAARVNDPHICSQHGGGVVTQGSLTVFIGNSQVARKDDLCHCLSVGVSGTGVPGQVSPGQFISRSYDSDSEFFHTDWESSDYDHDGTADTVSGEYSTFRNESEERIEIGPMHRNERTQFDKYYGEFTAGVHGDSEGLPGHRVHFQGEAGTGRQIEETNYGIFGHDIYTREQRIHGPRAWAIHDASVGDDGRNVGIAHGTDGAGYDLVQSQIGHRIDLYILEAEIGGETGIGGGAVGSNPLPHYDRVEDEIQMRGQLAGFFVAGLGGWFEIQIPVPDFITGGPVDDGGDDSSGGGSGPGSGPILNTIVTGCPTVFIGG